MRELIQTEVEAVNGAGPILDGFKDIRTVVKQLPDLYNDAVTAAADIMCRFTGNC